MRVQCKFCEWEKATKCLKKKKASVDLNKHRACDKYRVNVGKVDSFVENKMRQSKPEVEIRPDWFWDKGLRRAERKRHEMEQFQTTGVDDTTTMPIKDAKHPLTGDLSRFMSTTAAEEKNE